MEDWIQVGNPVVVWRWMYPERAVVSKIIRLTKTMFILENGDRFRISNLRLVGDRHSWSGSPKAAYLYSEQGSRIWNGRLRFDAQLRATEAFTEWQKNPTRENRLEAIRALEDVPDE